MVWGTGVSGDRIRHGDTGSFTVQLITIRKLIYCIVDFDEKKLILSIKNIWIGLTSISLKSFTNHRKYL